MSKQKNRLGVKVVGVFVAFVILIFVSGFIYVNDYYKADDTALDIRGISDYTDNVEVLVDGDYTWFIPSENKKDVGFVFYPGGKVESKSYVNLMVDIAKQGYTTVLVNMPYNLAVFGVDKASYAFTELEEIDRWYVGGHSLGGVAAAEFVKDSDMVEGLILLASYPSSDLSNTDLKVLSIYGSNDTVLDLESFVASKSLMPSDSQYVVIEGGNHSYFGNYGEQKGDGEASISFKNQQELTAVEIADFIDGGIID